MSVSIPVSSFDDAVDLEDTQPTPHTFYDTEMPALYAMSVRDHDETRGLIVFGNAFGELAVYDFSGSDPDALAECFVDLVFPAFGAGDGDKASEVGSKRSCACLETT